MNALVVLIPSPSPLALIPSPSPPRPHPLALTPRPHPLALITFSSPRPRSLALSPSSLRVASQLVAQPDALKEIAAAMPTFAGLRELAVRGSAVQPLDDGGLLVLLGGVRACRTLRVVSLGNNCVTGVGVAALADALVDLPHLQSLRLAWARTRMRTRTRTRTGRG